MLISTSKQANSILIWNGDNSKNKSHRLENTGVQNEDKTWVCTKGEEYEFSGPDGVSIFISDYNPKDSIVVNGNTKEIHTLKQTDLALHSNWVHKQALTHLAIKWLNAGLIPLPIQENKLPANKNTKLFKREDLYQKKPWKLIDPDPLYPEKNNYILDEFKQPNVVGIALLLGPVSKKHDLECFDFDTPDGFGKFISKLKEDHLELAVKIEGNYIEETVNKGVHFFAWVPKGLGKKTLLAEKPNGTDKHDVLIEKLGSKNCYAINPPTKLKDGIYKTIKGSLLQKGELKIAFVTKEELKIIIDTCVSFDEVHSTKALADKPNPDDKPAKVTKSPEYLCSPNSLPQNENNLKRANRYLKETYGWKGLADLFGYEIVGGDEGRLLGLHPGSTKKDHNCVFGPQNLGDPDTFKCFGNWHIKGPINYAQFYADNNAGGKEAWAKLFKEVDDAWGKLLGDPVDEPRLNFITNVSGNTKTDEMWETWDTVKASNNNIIGRLQEDILETYPGRTKSLVLAGFTPLTIMGHAFHMYFASKPEGGLIKPTLHQYLLAPTGAGKNHPKNYLGNFFTGLQEITNKKWVEINNPKPEYMESIASLGGTWQGVEDLLIQCPKILLLQDEVATMYRDRKNGDNFSGIQTKLREFHSVPNRYFTRAKAKIIVHDGSSTTSGPPRPKLIHHPIVSLLGFGQEEIWVPALNHDDFSSGTFGRILIARESRVHWIDRNDGSKNKPKRQGASVSKGIIDDTYSRIKKIQDYLNDSKIDTIPVSQEYMHYLDDKNDADYDRFSLMEDEGTYRGSIHGRATENAERIALLHFLGRLDGSMELSVEDLEYGFRVVENSLKISEKIGNIVLGSINQKEIDSFLRSLKHFKSIGKFPTRALITANWGCKNRNSAWVKDTLEPELEKLGYIKVTNKISGTYEVLQ